MGNAQNTFKRKLVDAFNQITSAQFASIKNYQNKQGEISNYVVNFGISVGNAKKRDLIKLRNFDVSTILNHKQETLKKAIDALIAAAEKNLNPDLAKRSNQSQAQTDAYFSITKNGAIRLHLESNKIFAFGLKTSKVVLVDGAYLNTPDNRSDLTKAKDAIRKAANLTANKYRSYDLGEFDGAKVNGTVISL